MRKYVDRAVEYDPGRAQSALPVSNKLNVDTLFFVDKLEIHVSDISSSDVVAKNDDRNCDKTETVNFERTLNL